MIENYLMGQQVYPDGSNVLCEIGNSQGVPMNIVNVVPGLIGPRNYMDTIWLSMNMLPVCLLVL